MRNFLEENALSVGIGIMFLIVAICLMLSQVLQK